LTINCDCIYRAKETEARQNGPGDEHGKQKGTEAKGQMMMRQEEEMY
jgi:hypothetical protein